MLSKEDFNNLLKELTDENLSTDRQLEIFQSLQNDKDTSSKTYDDLVDNTNKLKDDFNRLKKKSVDDFFNKGTDFTPETPTEEKVEVEEKNPLTYDDVIVE